MYQLTEEQLIQVNRRRTTGQSIAKRILEGKWPLGAQAHIGNNANTNRLPMIITAVWPDEFGSSNPGVNGQVFLDGNDTLWVTSAREGNGPGQWLWPEIKR
jgi:hypothetical protein